MESCILRMEKWKRNKLLNFTLMDKTQTIIVCHSFYSAVQYLILHFNFIKLWFIV